MTRAFVLEHQRAKRNVQIGLVVTVNSPLYGMDSAAFGVKTAPAAIPVWRDVASNSDFVKRVHAQPWPPELPYHLVFSYLDGEDRDGVVPCAANYADRRSRRPKKITVLRPSIRVY